MSHKGEIWEGYGRDMGGISDIPPVLDSLSTKAFPKKMGGMSDFSRETSDRHRAVTSRLTRTYLDTHEP